MTAYPEHIRVKGPAARRAVFAALAKAFPEAKGLAKAAAGKKEIVIEGTDARRKVWAALAGLLGNEPPASGEAAIVDDGYDQEDGEPTMTIEAKEIAELEHEIGKLEKIVKRHVAASEMDDLDDDDDSDDNANNADDDADEHGQLRDDADDDSDDEDDTDDDTEKRLAKVDGPTKFSAMTDRIAAEEGCPKTEAARRVRQRYLAQGYDDLSTQKSYRSLVDAEIRKGFSPTVAAQRVAYAHPTAAKAAIAKADTGALKFIHAVDQIMKRDGVSRLQAMAKARREHPAAFKRFQNV